MYEKREYYKGKYDARHEVIQLREELQRYRESLESCINMMEPDQIRPIRKQIINPKATCLLEYIVGEGKKAYTCNYSPLEVSSPGSYWILPGGFSWTKKNHISETIKK
jgi:hypothetical protein